MCVITKNNSSKESEDKDFLYGGQAVIEGVMMRGKTNMAVAIRNSNNEIILHIEELKSLLKKYKFLNKPFIRGPFVLIDALRMGIRALFISAKESLGEEEAKKELSTGAIAVTFFFSFLIGLVIFVILPTWVSDNLPVWIASILPPSLEGFKKNFIVLNLIEGLIRTILFLGYIALISFMEDIKRVFQYHGEEHKVIYTYEAGKELTVENARPFSCRHPRCGTSFIIMVLLISIILHAFWGWPELWLRIVSRLIMFPVIAGVAYEMTRLAGKKNPLFGILVLPGVWLQVLTTRNPSDDQLEVAIKALLQVLSEKTESLPSIKSS